MGHLDRWLACSSLTLGKTLILWGSVVLSGSLWCSWLSLVFVSPRVSPCLSYLMSLTGTYHRTVDEKQRLAVPKKLKEALLIESEFTVYVAPETDRALTLYSGVEFDRRAKHLVDLSAQRAEVRNYQRLYYSQAEQVELDGQGRIRLPERLMEFAGIEQEVVLLGVHDHIEVWDRTRWGDFLQQHSAEFDKMSAAAMG